MTVVKMTVVKMTVVKMIVVKMTIDKKDCIRNYFWQNSCIQNDSRGNDCDQNDCLFANNVCTVVEYATLYGEVRGLKPASHCKASGDNDWAIMLVYEMPYCLFKN